MPRRLDPRIHDVLTAYGEDPKDKDNVLWDCHGTWVIYHQAIERMAARAGVAFEKPQIIRAERDEAVIMVSGSLGERWDWEIGECLLNANYRVSPKQAAYVWAMATKRARDRLILKLLNLHGLIYSEEEADDFKKGGPADRSGGREADPPPAAGSEPETPTTMPTESIVKRLKAGVDAQPSAFALIGYMKNERVAAAVASLDEAQAKEVRGYAAARLGALGWVPTQKVGLSSEEVG